jgi:hypothetical protein
MGNCVSIGNAPTEAGSIAGDRGGQGYGSLIKEEAMEAIIRSTRMRFVALVTSGMLAIGLAAAPAASAQQSGLVNVDIHNVLNNNKVAVTIPINAAANICGVSVDVLSANLANGPVTCTAGANQQFVVSQ